MLTFLKKYNRLIICFLAGGLIGWGFGKWSVNNFRFSSAFFYNWQALIGAFIGAATPVSLYLLQDRRERKRKYRDLLVLLEKNIAMAINNLSGIDKMLHRFVENNLYQYKMRVSEDNSAGRFSVGQAFVPLSAAFVFDKNLLSQSTESSYLENLMLEVISTSQELPTMLEDINRQFDRTLSMNAQIGILRLNSPEIHNRILVENLKEFESFLNIQLFQHNIPVYLRQLISARVALQTMIKLGFVEWRKKFDRLMVLPIEERMAKMESIFKVKINAAITQIQSEFKSKLLYLGEKPPISE